MYQALWFAFDEVLATLNSSRGMKEMMLALSMFYLSFSSRRGLKWPHGFNE